MASRTYVFDALKDDRGCLHAPLSRYGDVAMCGAEGERIDHRVEHTARYCSACIIETTDDKGNRLWPVLRLQV